AGDGRPGRAGGGDRQRTAVLRRGPVLVLAPHPGWDVGPGDTRGGDPRPATGVSAGAGTRHGVRLRQDRSGLHEPARVGAGVVDVRPGRGGGADQQRGRAGGAAGGVVAEAVVRLSQRGRVSVRGTDVDGGTDAAAAGPISVRLPGRGHHCPPPRSTGPATAVSRVNGYWNSSASFRRVCITSSNELPNGLEPAPLDRAR